jgi:hypothetical protein
VVTKPQERVAVFRTPIWPALYAQVVHNGETASWCKWSRTGGVQDLLFSSDRRFGYRLAIFPLAEGSPDMLASLAAREGYCAGHYDRPKAPKITYLCSFSPYALTHGEECCFDDFIQNHLLTGLSPDDDAPLLLRW